MRLIFAISAMTLLAACSNDASDPDIQFDPMPSTTVQVEQGTLSGLRAENGARAWYGVPYAQDTAGENRWRAPHPALAWEGTREAVEFAEPCAQIATPFTQIEGFVNWTLAGSEDCLVMDIYAPSNSSADPLPVMIWIHGGSNVSGASQLYQGYNLAENENVIVASVQYRLGPLGWFSHEAVSENAETERDAAANFGLLDLIASLEWVQSNIEAFGGDPTRVTIFGESAGGHNVAALLASPLAEGLFHGAIIQSGSFDSTSVGEARGIEGELINASNEIVERLGGEENLRSASLQEVFDAYEKVGGYMELPRMIEDGISIPAPSLIDAFSSTDTFHNVPIITGTNKDEMKLFNLFNEELTKLVDDQFYVARDQGVYDAASDYTSRVWRIRAVDDPAKAINNAGHQYVYAYRFDWDEGGRFLQMDFAKMLGAAHSMEIPFVFNRFSLLGTADAILFEPRTAESREKLSRQMGAYWGAFARSGVPSTSEGVDWPQYGSEASLIYFDSQNDGGITLERGADTLESVLADLAMDQRVNGAQRCQIAEAISAAVSSDLSEELTVLGCN